LLLVISRHTQDNK